MSAVPERTFPMQGGLRISWTLAEIIYAGYSALNGKQQTLEAIAEIGGFKWSDVEYINNNRVGRRAIDTAMFAKETK